MIRILAVLAGLASCNPGFRECAAIQPAYLAIMPDRLSATGFDGPGVEPFMPRFTSWTDGATKRRWIYLPPFTQIDTTDPDAWNFPVGTKLWKELSRDGVRIETRMLFKHGPDADAWTPMAYAWRDDGDAYATPEGLANARGTDHDIPSAGTCVGCHGGVPSGVLGFSAIQLPRADLERLAAQHLVTAPLPANDLPGDATTQAALGYLHANCSHCHNEIRPARSGPRCFDPERSFSFLLRVADLDRPASTATYRTAIGEVIDASNPSGSELLDRIQSRDPRFGMPALGTEHVDTDGVRLLTAWIKSL